jgi:hypothetical protein
MGGSQLRAELVVIMRNGGYRGRGEHREARLLDRCKILLSRKTSKAAHRCIVREKQSKSKVAAFCGSFDPSRRVVAVLSFFLFFAETRF